METPIDPFSSSYWQKQLPAPTVTAADTGKPGLSQMQPPRVPLNAINRLSATINQPLTSVTSGGKVMGSLKVDSGASKPPQGKRMVNAEDMDDFKKAVHGSDLTKAGLIEVLKKRYASAVRIRPSIQVT